MSVLLLDTSREQAFVAVAENQEIVFLHTFFHENRLAEVLFEHIEAACKRIKKLDYIGVGVGPGSYTGTRVGVASAKGMSYAKRIPLISFCSLIAYIPKKEGSFSCAMQAKSGSYYVLTGEQQSGTIHYQKPDGLVDGLDRETQIVGEKDPLYPETPLLYTQSVFLSGAPSALDIIYLYNYPTVSYTQSVSR